MRQMVSLTKGELYRIETCLAENEDTADPIIQNVLLKLRSARKKAMRK